MHSEPITGAISEAKRASESPVAQFLARAGLAARGVIYILIGWVAVLVALGQSSQEADQRGALELLAGKPYGLVSLWLLGIAVLYAGFAYLTFDVISGTRHSQSRQQQDMTATAMGNTAGRWLVGIVGLAVVIAGLVLVSEGARRKFMKYLRTWEMSQGTRRVIELLGMIGTIARGLVFTLAGVLVISAAVTHKASQSGGIDKALLTLRNQPLGEFLVMLAALGLAVFGIYGLCEARWRKV